LTGHNNLTSLLTLPDSSYSLLVSSNPDLVCLPELKKITYFFFDSTGVKCVPDYGVTTLTFPVITTVSLRSVSNPNNCSTLSTETENMTVQNSNSVLVYPNSTSNSINIVLSKSNMQFNARLTTVLGQSVIGDLINDKQTSIDLSKLEAGIYYLSLSDANEVSTMKIVKQ